MSLYGALFAGVSGLQSHSSAMGAISDNVTNVNTEGYKGTKTKFSTLVTKQVSITKYSPGGVQSRPQGGIDVQGLLQATNSSTDIAISGQGFFVVNTNSDPASTGAGMFAYTRAGSFKIDKQGYLQNASGFYLQGWPLEPTDNSSEAVPGHVEVNGNYYMKAYKKGDGTWHYCNQNIINPEEVKGLNLNTIGGTADPTTAIRLGANLPSGDSIYDPTNLSTTGLHETNVLIYDSLGNSHSIGLPWMKTEANKWNIQTRSDIASLQGTLTAETAPIGTTITVTGRDAAYTGAMTTTATMAISSSGTMTLGAADTGFLANLPVGTTFSLGGTASNNNTFLVSAISDANGDGTNDTITVEEFPTLRGSEPPAGAATNTLYRTATTGDEVYASQGRLDFTASTNAEVAAMDGKTFTVAWDDGTNTGTITFEFEAAGNGVTAGNIAIDISGYAAAADRQKYLAEQVTEAMRDPINYTSGGNVPSLIPYVYQKENTVFICQRTNAAGTASGAEFQFNVSNLGDRCTQSATRTWTAGTPPTDAATGTFTVQRITQFDDAVEFNGDGTPKEITVNSIGIDWANGAESMVEATTDMDKRMSLFLGNANQTDGLTQLAGQYQIAYMTQNGAKFGNFSGVSIDDEGIVTAMFDNGVRRPIFQIPVATFVNPNGLEALTGNSWIETDTSGMYTLRTAGHAGAGTIAAAALEASTVDLGEEFTNMITTQRAYSAAAKIITTSDDMLDELIRIKR